MIHVVRHADAGTKSGWAAPDVQRPLTALGRRQAEALARRLAALEVSRVISAPAVRCMETVAPLAAALGIEVEAEPVLAEGTPPAAVDGLLARLDSATVLCSHGDIVGNLIDSLTARGVQRNGQLHWQKASTWVLSPNQAGIASARYVPPPDV